MNLRFAKEVFKTKSLFNSNKFILFPIKCAQELDFIGFSYVIFSNSEPSIFQIIIGLIVHCKIPMCDVLNAALIRYQLSSKLSIRCNNRGNKLHRMRQLVLKRDLDTDSVIISAKMALTGNQASESKSQSIQTSYWQDHWSE